MRNQPRLSYRLMDKPLTIADKNTYYMILHNYSFDSTLAPKGKTPIVIRFFTEYEYWEALSMDKKKYRAEKDAMAQAAVVELDKMYPGIAAQIEVIDVATPSTYTRYTETWRGATMSWQPTTANFTKNLEKTLPGLEGFYMVGQWLVPGGGLPNALKTARDAMQMICKKDKMKFQTTIP